MTIGLVQLANLQQASKLMERLHEEFLKVEYTEPTVSKCWKVKWSIMLLTEIIN